MTYTLGQSDFGIEQISDEGDIDDVGFLNFRYRQSSVITSDKFTRVSLFSLLWTIGGAVSLITRMSNLILNKYQSFTLDKSLIKKIFSWMETSKKGKPKAHDQSFYKKNNVYNYDDK